MKVKKVKTSALLMLPALTVLAASLHAADVSPVWVEYTSTPATTTSATSAATPAAATPVAATPAATAPSTDVATPAVTSPAIAAPAAAAAAATAPDSPRAPTTGNKQPAVAAAASTNGSATTNGNGLVSTAVITPRLFAFDYFKSGNENLPQYLERYDYREALNGNNNRSGAYADLDFSLNMNDGDRDVFVIERLGFGEHNHRGMARFDDDEITLSGSYNHYRSATGGIDYLYSPAVVPGADIATYPGTVPPNSYAGNLPFSNGSTTTDYHIDRTSYAAGFKMKPSLLGGSVSLDVNYEGYMREGNQLAPAIFMTGQGSPTVKSWNGVNLAIDERMNKFGFTLSASPNKLFDVAYDISMEKFTNQAADLTRADIVGPGPGLKQNVSPFYFVPDTSLLSQNFRLSKRFDHDAILAAGIGHSTLKDESSPERYTGPESWEGEINSSTAYVTGNANVSETVSVEGHIKYYNRDNDSSFPVPAVIAPDSRMSGPRINSIDSMDYGLAAIWRPGTMSSNVTLGWQRLDLERDLTYAAWGEGIPANRIFYREDTLSDEVYLKWIAVPSPGVTVRLNPSYLWSDKTGLITEPEEAVKFKAMVSYAAPEGWLLSGFYDYKNKKNNDLYVTGDLTGAGAQYNQDLESTFHTAGATLNMLPSENVSTSVSLYWMQNDLANYFLSSNLTRQVQNPNIVFVNYGLSNYKVDSYVLTLSGDWQTSEKLKLSGSYTFTQNKGDAASGEVLLALQAATGTVDSRFDNTLQSVSLGADYTLSPKTTLRANYFYDYYDDDAYSLLTGGVNTLAIGLSYSLQ